MAVIGNDRRRDKESIVQYVDSINNFFNDIKHDVVNKPAHYNHGSIEAIDYIKQQLGAGFVAYCEGNVHKYLHRWKYKNGLEDLNKARWYLDKMIESEYESPTIT